MTTVEPVYDEFFARGEPRAHHRLLLEHVRELAPSVLPQGGAADDLEAVYARRGAPGSPLGSSGALMGLRKRIRERLTEQEVTYNILGAPDGSQRPWQLDPLPWVLDPVEFDHLSRGLAQRGRLLEAILDDLYGPQSLCRQGVLPLRAVLGNPHFWRACHGWSGVGGRRLWLYAADVGRAPDGSFCVFSDRTAAPAGSGYALENRLVIGRELAGAFRRYPVRKLNQFFRGVRAVLEGLSPQRRDEPRIVVLSAGVHDESSFEHAYLARYLGFELVEGRDLTVRDDVVYLKTLGGLKRVDVVWRRIFDDFCDPLELREGALGGVPGLVAAARAGNVGLANPLGSALLESPVFQAYLPAVSRHLLGEELVVPSVPTWWLGDEASARFVIDHLDEMVIKPAFDERRAPPLEPATLSAAEREHLVERLRRRPHDFVAQRWPHRSVGPYLEGEQISRGHLALRMFMRRSGDDFEALPGGLARVASTPDGLFLFAGGEQGSKDVWVPWVGSQREPPLPSMPEPDDIVRRSSEELPSRLLDDLYWLGRCLERVDNIARVVRHALDRAGDEIALGSVDVEPCAAVLRRLGILDARGDGSDTPRIAGQLEELLAAIASPGADNDLRSSLGAVRNLTQRVRSRLSRDVWFGLQQLGKFASELNDGPPQEDMIGWLDRLLLSVAAVSGGLLENMVRGSAWSFVDMGRRVERATFVLALLTKYLPGRASRAHLEAVLGITDSLLTYRARYLSRLRIGHVVDLLLTDDTNPHSVLFQVHSVREQLLRLPGVGPERRSPEQRSIVAIEGRLLAADLESLCAGEAGGLAQLTDELLEDLWAFSDVLTDRYFSHAGAQLHLAGPSWVEEGAEVEWE